MRERLNSISTFNLTFVCLSFVALSYFLNNTQGKLNLSSQNYCKLEHTSHEPFYIVEEHDHYWSSLYDHGYQGRASRRVEQVKEAIYRGSKVSLLGTFNPNNVAADFIPIEILTPPHNDVFQNMITHSNLKFQLPNAKLEPAKPRSSGVIQPSILKRASSYNFILSNKATKTFFDKNSEFHNKVLQLSRNENSEFVTKTCCDSNNDTQCKKNYKFETVLEIESSNVFIDTSDSKTMLDFIPLSSKEVSPVLYILGFLKADPLFNNNIKNLEMDFLGRVKVPTGETYEEANVLLQKGPFGSIHYKPDDNHSNDAFAHPLSACAFIQAIKHHHQECITDGCIIQWGNFYHPKNWRVHESHESSQCVDIRPQRTKHKVSGISLNPTDVTYDPKNYDREKTIQLINTLKKYGGSGHPNKITPIIFNDSVLVKKKITQYVDGHDNHLHVCFPINSSVVLAACDI